MKYNPKKIEAKWAKVWDKKRVFKVDIKNAKKPFYNLAMFPYPSAEGLHVGHIIPYSGVDTYGRYLRMNGYDVFEPMGFDAFGIHSENFAIKKGLHPKTLISQTTRYFREKQMKRLGTLFDWDREVNTTDPNYYKWTQWLFIQMYKHNLAEKKKAPVTYCPSCKTVLSDEQTEVREQVTVCERCKTPIERREMEQWFFKITKYADKLLANLDHINWSEKTKRAQRNWIGKSEGINISYDVENTNEKIVCFTTRPDTNFGATFIVLAPEHEFVKWVLKQKTLSNVILGSDSDSRIDSGQARMTNNTEQLKEISSYVKKATTKSEQERISEGRDKTGVFTGFYAINQLNHYRMPIYVSDFVIGSFGTGAVVAVPASDIRDFEFAKEFNIPVKRIIVGQDGKTGEINKIEDVCEEGTLINSEFLNGLERHIAAKKMIDYIEQKGWGKRVTTFKLRDWCISRQRYWGPPIPMINCPKCGWNPVPEKDLPVLLPFIKDYKPTGDGKSPLAKNKKWMKVKCPNCGGWAERETDVSDTFLDSAWYFLRYPSVDSAGPASARLARSYSPKAKTRTTLALSPTLPWDPSITSKWLPVDMYIGGNEHAVLHLMYSRFVTMALKDMGYIDFAEPFKRFFAHGLLISEGAKMSKSRGNVVNPNIYLDKYGADTLRMYILFLGPYDAGGDFRDTAIAGMYRFLNRVWTLVTDHGNFVITEEIVSRDLLVTMHKTIKKVTEDINSLHFNTAISSIMEYYNVLSSVASSPHPPAGGPKNPKFSCAEWDETIKTLLLLLAPFAPFISEELWSTVGESSIHNQPWPIYNEKLLVEEKVTIVIQINGKVRDKIELKTLNSKLETEVKKLALESEKVKTYLSGKKMVKTIFVPGKLINLVV
ncbi:leucine--tRNA ligase [Candidatus Gottesmanbacteria bacterium]|nr:leucine--tRNA ligase [Candidatus Gottesmanbacteria bacterium]